MAADKKVLNVPHLRFPEFTEEWRFSTLGNECDILCGYAFDGEDILEKAGDVLLMRGINISEGFIRHSGDLDRFYSGPKEKLSKYVVRKGDVVIGMDGSKVGRNAAIVTEKEDGAYLVQRVCRLRSTKTDVKLLIQYINSPMYYRYVDAVKTASAIPHISQTDIHRFCIYLPENKQEQEKLCNLLSALDERIATQNKIIEDLEQLKSAIYHRVFSTIKCKTVTLKSIASIVKGRQLNGTELSENGNYYVMNGGIVPSGYYHEYNTPANTISISEGGNSCGYVQFNYKPFWSGGHCYTLHLSNEEVNLQYLYHFLRYREKDIMALRIGSGLPNI